MDLVAYNEKSRQHQMVAEMEKAIQENTTNVKNKMGNQQRLAKSLGTTSPEELKREQEEYMAVLRDLRQQRNVLSAEKGRARANLDAQLARQKFISATAVPDAEGEKALDADPALRPLATDLARAKAVASRYEASAGGPEEAKRRGDPTYLAASRMVADIE